MPLYGKKGIVNIVYVAAYNLGLLRGVADCRGTLMASKDESTKVGENRHAKGDGVDRHSEGAVVLMIPVALLNSSRNI